MKSYIITLKGHELSERVSKECVTQAAKFNIDVTVFDAIWGKDYLEHLASTGLKLGRVKKSRMDLGHYGNFFSHYYLWQKCLELNEPLIILEHDGFFIRKMPNDILDKFTDLLKLDCENPFKSNYYFWVMYIIWL
jgi:GR25 family glycosyltransferase involved in LPS biosynthesis